MRRRAELVALALLCLGAEGRVVHRGDPPPAKRASVFRDKHVCGETQPDLSVLVSKDGGLANVVVWVDAKPSTDAPPATPVVMDQRDCRYVPRVVAARVGQKLAVLNSDRVLHNSHSYRGEETVFNVAFPFRNGRREYVMDEPGMLRLTCDAGHDWMAGYVHVFEHPWFAVTSSDGRFALPALPPGKHVLRAWHEKLGEKTVEVEAGKRVEIAFP